MFRCLNGLGGLLVVAFVAPVGASRNCSVTTGSVQPRIAVAADKAEQLDRQDEERRQQQAADDARRKARLRSITAKKLETRYRPGK